MSLPKVESEPAAPSRVLPEHIPTLDGWRAVAILLVIYCHCGEQLFGEQGLVHVPQLARAAARGGFGVSIFFAISGLLITARLLDERAAHGRISLKSFYLRRIFRILPASTFYLAVVATLGALAVISVSGKELLASLLFYRNYLPKQPQPFTEHFWSLSIEEHFYFIWPALLVLFGRRGKAWVVVLALLVALWKFIDFKYHLTVTAEVTAGNEWATPHSDHVFDRLLWGCWFALLLKDPHWFPRLERWLKPAVMPLLVVLLIANGVLKPLGKDNEVLARILVPAMLTVTALSPRSIWGRMLEAAPMRFIGRLSYSLYLWQQLWFFAPGMYTTFGRFSALVALLGTFVTAWLSYHLIEKPLIKLGRRYASA
jgi:peptidoglycan/LPS O-acetylase OafA/YrhL